MSTVITITLNGETKVLPHPMTLAELVVHLGLKAGGLGLEHNRTMVLQAAWDKTPLADGDEVEAVRFVGGG